MFYDGDDCELLKVIYPQPADMTEHEYSVLSSYFAYCNLIKPSVNRLVSGVYSGKVTRRIEEDSPYKNEVEEFLSPANGYSADAREWFKSGIHYGTGVMAFVIEDNEVKTWMPNPIHTEIVCNPRNVKDIWGVFEKVGTEIRFVDKMGWGLADENGNLIQYQPHGLGVVPAVPCYGESQLMYGKIEGLSLVRSAIQYSAVVSKLMLHCAELVKTYSAPQAVATGEIQNTDPEEAFARNGVMEMKDGGRFSYESPETNFKDLIALIIEYKVNFCISSGIPMDALDPSNTPENQSATTSRIRAQTLSTTVNRLIEEQIIAEIKALIIVGALYQFIATQKVVTFKDFKKRFKCSVTINPSNPESQAEEAQAWMVLKQLGAKTIEDIIRHFNQSASEAEIKRRLEAIENSPPGDLATIKQALQGDLGEQKDSNNARPGESPEQPGSN